MSDYFEEDANPSKIIAVAKFLAIFVPGMLAFDYYSQRDNSIASKLLGISSSESQATSADQLNATVAESAKEHQKMNLTDGLYSLNAKCDLYKKYAAVPVTCIDEGQYEEICKKVDGYAKAAARNVIFDAAFKGKIDLKAGETLIENNQIYDFQSNWDAEKRKCKYKFVLEGMVGGNSYRSSYIEGVAHTFKVSGGGDPFVYEGEPDYNFQ